MAIMKLDISKKDDPGYHSFVMVSFDGGKGTIARGDSRIHSANVILTDRDGNRYKAISDSTVYPMNGKEEF